MKKKTRILLVDEASNWLQIWTAASSLDVKGIKKEICFFSANCLVFPNTVTYVLFNSLQNKIFYHIPTITMGLPRLYNGEMQYYIPLLPFRPISMLLHFLILARVQVI